MPEGNELNSPQSFSIIPLINYIGCYFVLLLYILTNTDWLAMSFNDILLL